jgi:hypothetical protein
MSRFSVLRTLLVASTVLAIHHPALAAERCAGSEASARECSASQVNRMKIRIVVGDTTLNATPADNPTARDFASLLPLTLELKDYAQTEKVSDLPRRLSTAGAPAGSDPDVGDIAYYSPWGNLASFHKEFRYSKGLIKLGRIDTGIEALRRSGPLAVTIELVVD